MFALGNPVSARQSADRTDRPGNGDDDDDFICRPMCFPRVLAALECRAITQLGEAGNAINAGLTHSIEGYRTGRTRLVERSAHSDWLYKRIGDLLERVNLWYRFEVVGLVEALLYCEYPAGGHFDWHVDCGEGRTRTRKISLSIQLSEHLDYDGGGLEFAAYGELGEARRLGTAVTFPAFVHHRVAPVSRGMRRSLVAWAHGPMFR